MSAVNAPRGAPLWGYAADLPVEEVAVAYGAGWTAAADGSRTVYILDVQGILRGEFQADYAVRSLAASDDGLRFMALAGPDTAYLFDAHGILQLEVVFGAEVNALAGDATLSRLVALCADDTLVVRQPQTGSETTRELDWHPTSVALANPDPLMVALADSEGRVALLDASCSARWAHRLHVSAGPVCSDGKGRVVALPAGSDGLLLFDPKDGQRDSLVADEPVRRAVPLREMAGYVVQLGTGSLVLLGGDGRVLWRRDLSSAPAAWAVGAQGRLLTVARGGREIAAYELPEAAAGEQEPSTEYMRIERAIAGLPGVPTGEVAWSNELPAEVAQAGVDVMRMGARGDFVVLVSAEGAVISYDMQGAAAGEGRVIMPTYLAPRIPQSGVVVWNLEGMLVLRPAEGHRTSHAFEPKTRYLDCSADLGLLCAVGVDGAVRAWAGVQQLLWTKELDPAPTTVRVSPGGELVVVRDQSRRFLHYTADGRLFHKARFSGGERLGVLGVGDQFVVFGDRKGQVVVLSPDGKEIWGGRPLAGLRDVEVLDECVAMYSRDRHCLLLYPTTGEVCRFNPPPGWARVRLQEDGRPVLFHCVGSVLTVYARSGRGLDALWHFELEADVTRFEPDRTAHCVALVAGGSVHAVRAPDGA